ncbi:hypothetical protein I3843_04G124400 [Carya illinoinensis]|nr:hypothetical protein I3843_04G124400 [Carya illinoinensis]
MTKFTYIVCMLVLIESFFFFPILPLFPSSFYFPHFSSTNLPHLHVPAVTSDLCKFPAFVYFTVARSRTLFSLKCRPPCFSLSCDFGVVHLAFSHWSKPRFWVAVKFPHRNS